MPLVVCACCRRRRNIDKRPRGTFRCSNCGAQAARVIRKLKWWMQTSDFDGVAPDEARHSVMAQLKDYAEMKGYKPGWAAFKFKVLFGRWPNGEAAERGQTPNGELVKWFWKQAAEYSAQKRKEQAATIKPKAPEPSSPIMSHEDYGVKW